MNLRAMLGAGLALLLPLPLVLTANGLLQSTAPEYVRGRRVSPVLSVEERAHLRTYHRDCGPEMKCEPPLGCLEDARARAHYCSDSQCRTDAQCPDGQVCQLLATQGQDPMVRTCAPMGLRTEGERCVKISESQEGACAPGLHCSTEGAFCGRPCVLNDPASCPPHFFCVDDWPAPLCLPTCEQSGCPEGQHCIRHEAGASACARVLGPRCQEIPCPEGQECKFVHASRFPDRIWSECEQRCGQDFPPCPTGLICDGWSCKQPCQPDGPSTCADGFRCFQRRPSSPWVCHPDW
ncbi:hypothetical protein NVS55_05250 [Myxococcus stipitatus]|uniref:hypothetical protein n=1 Tax=Myxococcus stipitatus TaxID=83455 RepID=UPI003144F668